jgi:putative hydrolase of the HAD superfamily
VALSRYGYFYRADPWEFIVHRIRAITLDLDNTLWAIDPVIRRAEARLWEWLSDNYPRIPAQFSTEGLLEVRESVMEEHLQRSHDLRFLRKKVLAKIAVDSGYTEELVEPAFAVFDRARNDVELYPDVMPGLELLAGDFVLVAVTNGNANLETIGIRHLFHDVVAAAEAGCSKPARPIFDQAVARSGCLPDEILHVGDHPETDVKGAQEAGLRTAWINRNGETWPDDLPEPDAVVTTIPELQELLQPAVQSINKAT